MVPLDACDVMTLLGADMIPPRSLVDRPRPAALAEIFYRLWLVTI